LVSTSRGDPLRRASRSDVASALSPGLSPPLVAFAWTAEIRTRSSSTVWVGCSRHDLEVPTSGLRGIRTPSRSQRMASLLPTSLALGWRSEIRRTAACKCSTCLDGSRSTLRASRMSPSTMTLSTRRRPPHTASSVTSGRTPRIRRPLRSARRQPTLDRESTKTRRRYGLADEMDARAMSPPLTRDATTRVGAPRCCVRTRWDRSPVRSERRLGR
jgi:hypothetical protein